jgi:putative nucleotidyltransferase with HDIG domain
MNRTNIVKSIKLSGAYLLGLGVVVFFTMLCPKYVQFPYSFRDGQIWNYEDLYAPFDFPVFKTPDEVLAEEENLRVSFAPYYSVDRTLPARMERQLEQAFREQLVQAQQQGDFKELARNPSSHLDYSKRLLQYIYQKGIIQLDSLHQSQGNELVIELISGNASQRRTRQQLLDQEQAQGVLLDSLPYSGLPYADFLFPILSELLIPNIFYNDSLTSLYFNQQLSERSQALGIVSEGELIVPRGGRVHEDVYRQLLSFQRQYQDEQASQTTQYKIMLGYFLLAFFIVGVFILYIQVYEPKAFSNLKELVFLLMWLTVFSYLMFLIEQTEVLSPYLIPFCIAPIVISIFYNARLAFFTHLIVILLVSILTSQGYEFTIIQIVAGVVAVMSKPDARNWTRFFGAMLYILLAYVLIYFGLTLIQEGSFLATGMVVYVWFFASVFLTLLAYPLIPLLERLFGFVSSISLMELSDMNRTMLKELALKAPGTLQHSLQVGNLAEAAADAIGADALLIRVAALYHDIGKTVQPEYFIENQSGVNPHDELEQKNSAAIIIGHVSEGVRLARKHRLPEVVTRFILTHHGTTRVEYFYRSYCKECEDGEKDAADFTYPGPKPKTKEESILMLADSLEASSKSLKNPTSQSIDELINAIIQTKINLGQLDESELSFQELETCKVVFRKILRSIHHVRVEYPK